MPKNDATKLKQEIEYWRYKSNIGGLEICAHCENCNELCRPPKKLVKDSLPENILRHRLGTIMRNGTNISIICADCNYEKHISGDMGDYMNVDMNPSAEGDTTEHRDMCVIGIYGSRMCGATTLKNKPCKKKANSTGFCATHCSK